MRIHQTLAGGALTAFVGVMTMVSAQELRQGRQFDVASVKENTAQTTRGMLSVVPGGGVMGRHTSLATMIRFSFGIESYQIANAPEWISTTYYDVSAKTTSSATRADTLAMLRMLLAQRFKLAVHQETRSLDGFALIRENSGRKLGPSLRTSNLDCVNRRPTACNEGLITSTGYRQVGLPLGRMVSVLSTVVGRPITDQTGLDGLYDAELHWSDDREAAADAPVIFTALREQLGLRLRGGRFPHPVVVIDHAERPDPD